MPTLAATLKSEIRKLTARELKKAVRPLRRLNRQMKALRALARAQQRTIGRLERRLQRVRARASGLRRRRLLDSGPRVSPAAIRSLRRRMKMTRHRFAKMLKVSPGSIFGWETGRSIPRGPSRQKLVALKSQGVSGRAGRRPARSGRRRTA